MRGFKTPVLVVWGLLALSFHGRAAYGAEVQLKTCGNEKTGRIPQTYTGKLRIQWDSFRTSQITTALAAIILSENMGFDVVLEGSFSPANMYKEIAGGERLHLAFETWPASNPAPTSQYVVVYNGTHAPQGKVNAYPYIDLFGRSGIFETCSRESDSCASLPQNTGVLIKEALKSPAGQEHFRVTDYVPPCSGTDCEYVPAYCSHASCDVQILHIAKTGYDEGLVEALVEKLKIPARVAYLGPQAHTDALWTAYTEKKGALVYSYIPNENQHGISILSLDRAKIAPGDDFQSQQLQKLAYPGLKDMRGGDALEFMQNFDLSESEYEDLAALNDVFDDAQEAACAWYKQNQAKWRRWVKFPEREVAAFWCFEADDGLCDARYLLGWGVFFGQAVLVIVLRAYAKKLRIPPTPLSKAELRAGIDRAINRGEENVAEARSHMVTQRTLWKWIMEHTSNYQTRAQFLDEWSTVPKTLTHKRTFENFTKTNTDKGLVIPPAAGADRWSAELKRSSLFPYLFFSAADGMRPTIITCVALGLGSGCVATFMYLLICWETYKKDPSLFQLNQPVSGDGTTMMSVKHAASSFESLVSAFKFFPSFLQIGYLGYAVSRWRAFQQWGYDILGALNTTALVVGSSLAKPETEACKRLAFRIHRYLVTVHILNYKKFNVWYEALTMEDLVKLGLLLPEEVENLTVVSLNGQRETINSWIAREMYEGVHSGLLYDKVQFELARDIRVRICTFQGQFYQNQPNLWAALMKFVCDLLIMMFVAGTPFMSFIYELGPFQFFVVVSSFLQSIPWLCASVG